MMLRNQAALAARLQKVLQDYKTLANSDPQQLRSLFPAAEIWRLFIDGHRQAKNIDLNQYMNLDMLRHPMAAHMLHFNLAKFSTCRAAKSSWPELMRYLKLSDDEMQRVTVADLIKFNKGWFLFERSEPGYLSALYRVFQYALLVRKKFDLNFIKRLHLHASTGVRKTNYDLEDDCSKAGVIRTRKLVGFPLRTTNASAEGILEILQENNGYNFFVFDNKEICAGSVDDLRVEYKQLDLMRTQRNKFWHDIVSSRSLPEVAQALYAQAARYAQDERKLFLVSRQDEKPQVELKHQAVLLLADFHVKLADAKTPLAKLSAIVWIIKMLERLHMFDDLNCRTLCMAGLIHLLVNHGFPFAIQFDPNAFDAKKHDELIEAVIEGMENTFKLIREQQLYGIKTSDLLNLLQTTNTIGATSAYFEQAVAIEVRARRRVYMSHFPASKRKRDEQEKIENDHVHKKPRTIKVEKR